MVACLENGQCMALSRNNLMEWKRARNIRKRLSEEEKKALRIILKKGCFLGNMKLTYEKKIDCVQLAEILIFAFV